MKTVLHIQVPGQTGRYERFYKVECEDSRADTLRKAITAWAKKPSDYEIKCKAYTTYGTPRGRKPAPVVNRSEDTIPGVEVDATVGRALAE